jgi:hypothetical protein
MDIAETTERVHPGVLRFREHRIAHLRYCYA